MAEQKEDFCEKMLREMQQYQAKQKEEQKQRDADSERVRNLMAQTDAVTQRYDDFKDAMSNAVDDAAEAAAKGMCPGLSQKVIQSLTHQPIQVDSGVQAAQYLQDCRHIMILTGAGLSAASGIPTFRGAGGFWTKSYAGVADPTSILTRKFFEENPQPFWDWHFDFDDILVGKSANAGHFAIQKFMSWQRNEDPECLNASTMLVTQNIDNLHTQAMIGTETDPRKGKIEGTEDFAFTDNVVELHGNTAFMRCLDFCDKKWYKALNRAQVKESGLPQCEKCSKIMKPHSMCFDETYSEELYQSNTVYEYLKTKCDGLIVIGTALQTSYAKKVIFDLIERDDVPIVEVNLEANIEHGYTLHLLQKSEICLPLLFDELIRLKSS